MMIRILWVILMGSIAAHSNISKAAATATEEAPDLEEKYLSGTHPTPLFSPMTYSPAKPATSPTFAIDERKCAAAHAPDERSFISPATIEEGDSDSLTTSPTTEEEARTYYSSHGSAGSLCTTSEAEDEDAATEVDTHYSSHGSVESSARRLSIIPELEDEDDAEEPTSPLGATRIISARLDKLFKDMDIGTLISSTSEEQRIFFRSLAFEDNTYIPSFYMHTSFQKLLADINACTAYEKPNYSLQELFANVSEFFNSIISEDQDRGQLYFKKAQHYWTLAIQYSEPEEGY